MMRQDRTDSKSATNFPLDPWFFRRLESLWLKPLDKEKTMRTTLMLVIVVFCAGVPSAFAQESKLSEKQKTQLIKRFPKSDANKDGELDDAELRALR